MKIEEKGEDRRKREEDREKRRIEGKGEGRKMGK